MECPKSQSTPLAYDNLFHHESHLPRLVNFSPTWLLCSSFFWHLSDITFSIFFEEPSKTEILLAPGRCLPWPLCPFDLACGEITHPSMNWWCLKSQFEVLKSLRFQAQKNLHYITTCNMNIPEKLHCYATIDNINAKKSNINPT